MNRVLSWVVTLGLGYLGLLVLVWALQGCMIHIPAKGLTASPADIGLGYEDVTLLTRDDETLHGWWVPAVEERGTLLFFHGNAGNISHRLESLRIFHELQLSVLIIDYRGYGQSSGRPSESGLYRDAQTAYDYLIETRSVPPGQLIVFGRSLGAAVGANLAAGNEVGALIIESGFTSVPDVGADLYPFLPVRLLARYQYNTAEALTEVSAPVLIIHSRDDEIIPYEHGRALFDAAPEPREFLEIGGDHNTGFMRSRSSYVTGLRQFLQEWYWQPAR